MTRPTARTVADMAIVRASGSTIPYSEEDCKGFVEKCINLCGGSIHTSGTNDMVRNHCAWLGTLSNARAAGKLVPGAFLLIWKEESDQLPAKYRGDGLGDFNHIGIYVGDKGFTEKGLLGTRHSYEVVHSSKTKGKVAGSTLKNGWTHVLYLQEVDYGTFNSGVELGQDAKNSLDEPSASEEQTPATETAQTIRVVAPNGGPVRVREGASLNAVHKKGFYAYPGEQYRVEGEKNGFYRIYFQGKYRWISKQYTEAAQ